MDTGLEKVRSRLDRQYDFLRDRYDIDIAALNKKIREQGRRQYEYELEIHLDNRDLTQPDKNPYDLD